MINPVFEAYGEKMRWIENPENEGFRFVGLTHDVDDAVDHTGWHLSEDNWIGETVSGVVYQVSGKNGAARYVVGYADPYNSDKNGHGPACLAMRVIDGDVTDCDWASDPVLRDAAREADGIAELMAEKERDYQAAHWAGREAREKATEAREACKAWVQATKASFAIFRNRHNIEKRDLKLLFKAQSEQARYLCKEFKTAREKFHAALDTEWHDVDTWRDGYSNY